MSHYEPGKEYFLKATVRDICPGGQYRLRLTVPVSSSLLKGECTEIYVANEPGILLTASEVAATIKDGKLYSELVEDKNAEVALYADEVKKLRSERDDLQKAVEALNKDIDGYRATIQKMADVIGFLCGTGGEQDG